MFLYSELFTSATHNSLAQHLVLEEKNASPRRQSDVIGGRHRTYVSVFCLHHLFFSLQAIVPIWFSLPSRNPASP